jgi:hypothetical protein
MSQPEGRERAYIAPAFSLGQDLGQGRCGPVLVRWGV